MNSCKDCKFWHKGEPQYVYGFCHRYPPRPGFMFSVRPGKWGEGGEASEAHAFIMAVEVIG